MAKVSLQWRITLLTAFILIVSSVSITAFSMYSAQKMLTPLLVTDYSIDELTGETNEVYDSDTVASSPAEKQKKLFDLRSIGFCFFITFLGTGAAWFVSGRALKPVRELCLHMVEIDENSLEQRLPLVKTKDEIGQLTVQFNHMLERLEEAFRRQRRFTASAAHELKTPLATVKAGMQVMKRDKNATIQEYQENADLTIRSIDRLSCVVNDLLLLASSEEKETVREKVELDVLFEAIIEELAPYFDEMNISVETDFTNANILYGDSEQLYRAFYNLVENAYKYNKPQGKITVQSKICGEFTEIEISDTGRGIPEEKQGYIFEPFYRVDASRSRKIAGAGLGLSIVQTIVEKYHGEVSVQSKLGDGTVFTIKYPNMFI